MALASRIAGSDIGDWFTADNDFFAYVPVFIFALIGICVFVPLTFALSGWFGFYFLALFLALAFNMSVTFSKYNGLGLETQRVMEHNWDMTKQERSMLPKNAVKKAIKYDNSSVSTPLNGLMREIIHGRVDNQHTDFIAQIESTRESVKIRNETYKEFS